MAYMNCHLHSRYLAHETQICVLIPDDLKEIPADGCKVLYLLHGRGDDCTSWVRNSNIERYARDRGIVVVMPSAETSFYVNGISGKRFYSYIAEELPEWIRRWFPVSDHPEKTFLAGLSMGAYGALRIGLNNPERYARIGIFSAGIRPDLLPDFEETDEGNEILHENIRAAFGTAGISGKDDPYELIRNLKSEGRQIPPILHFEGRQDMLYEMNAKFRDFARSQKIDYRYEEWEGGHDWIFWDEALRRLCQEI